MSGNLHSGLFDGLIHSGEINWQPPSKKLRVKKLSETAILPTKANDNDAGFDLYADEDVRLYDGPNTISTSIALEIPEGYVGLIWPRSGMAVRHGIDVLAGVIDSGYRGEIKVCLEVANRLEDRPMYEVKKGDKIAQILIQEVPRFEVIEAESLSDSNRGAKGFGSSGS